MNPVTLEVAHRNDVLSSLRNLGPTEPLSLAAALQLAERQAIWLRRRLGIRGEAISDGALRSLPSIRVARRAGLAASGITIRTAAGYDIALAADETPERQRCTLAHEIKHAIDDPDIERLYPWATRLDFDARVEQICDQFARELLMPARLLRRDWRAGHRSTYTLAARYEVSTVAMSRRLNDLKLRVRVNSPQERRAA